MKKTTRRSKQSSPVVAAASDANEKQHYEERIHELERENKAYQTEIAELKERKGNNSSASNDGVEKLKKDYLQKLNLLEDQVSELKKKLGSQSQFSTHRKRADESTRQLQYEIQNLKAHKAKLQCTIKLESVRFRLSKALLEKEVLQLKKEGRRNEIKTRSLLSSNEMLKMVLQRKTEEASAAIKRLRDMIAARKATLNRSSGAKNKSGQVIQDAEHELEVTTQLHKLCSQYESKIEKMTGEIAQLKEEIEMQRQDLVCCVLFSRIWPMLFLKQVMPRKKWIRLKSVVQMKIVLRGGVQVKGFAVLVVRSPYARLQSVNADLLVGAVDHHVAAHFLCAQIGN